MYARIERKLLLVAAAAAGSLIGCIDPLPGSCKTDADCGDGICDREIEQCFARDAGTDPVDAGADAGMDAGVCDPACAAFEECVESTCSPMFSGLSITMPAGGKFSPGAMVDVTAVLHIASVGPPQYPDTLELTVTAPDGSTTPYTMTKEVSTHAATVTLGTADGSYSLVARYPAAGYESAPVVLIVDGTAPTFAVDISPAPAPAAPDGGTTWTDAEPMYASAYRRDEQMTVKVTSDDEDVEAASVIASVKIGSGAAKEYAVVADSTCANANWCGTVTVPLWEPEMPSFRETVTVAAKGADSLGNQGTYGVAETQKVTRWKWVHEQVGGPEMRASPAVAQDGAVVFGTKSGGTSGKLVVLNADGTLRWEKALGAVTASPSIGASGAMQAVYVAANDAIGGAIHGFRLSDGTELQGSPCSSPASGTIEASLVVQRTKLSNETAESETATSVVNGSVLLLSLRPDGKVPCDSRPAPGESGTFPASLAASGSSVYYAGPGSDIEAAVFTPSGWTSRPGWPVDLGLFARALAISGSTVVGGAGGGPNQGLLFTVPEAGNVSAPDWSLSTNSPAWNPVVGTNDVAWVGLTNQNLIRATLGNSASAQTIGAGTIVKGAPLLGQGGWLYAAGSTGTLQARSQAAPANPVWSVSGLGTIESSPNIDCSRDATGAKLAGRPGVLYVTSNSGKAYAFIVDSRGIDKGPWPKYQHDPRNTGNAGTDLAEFECQ